MEVSHSNPFDDLFEEENYVLLKNYLYNYLLRKRAVEKNIVINNLGLILEVGSGLSPMITNTDAIVYSDISLAALQILRRRHGKGFYVVADGMHLPFKSDVFDQTICSEVLEHLTDDRLALKELARVMRLSSQLILTFPHRQVYFTYDDRFVNHLRRYELTEMTDRLEAVGLSSISIQKVLGPLEKVTMCFVLFCFSLVQKHKTLKPSETGQPDIMRFLTAIFQGANLFYAGLAWLDARIMPRSLATVLLIRAEKEH